MNKRIYHILIILLFPALLHSQEIMTGLYTNALVRNASKTMKTTKSTGQLHLPFVDDFSSVSIFPDDSLWADKYAFVNSSYPYYPPTVGVATLDALNDTGALYTEATAFGFAADSLTSNEILLDSIYGSDTVALKISDSLYFSFYYQPQGNGNAPEVDDSLVLEFYSPKDTAWYHIWSSAGSTLAEFYTDYNVFFKQVMIPITDSVTYFHKGFRFRFCNYASLANNSMPSWAGNVDNWNIDYVYLNKGRNMADSVYKDIAFVEPAPSTLKNYYAMPWSQYCVNPAAEMKDTMYMTISNLDTVTYNSSYKYDVYDESGSVVYPYNGGSYNIDPFVSSGYQYYFPHARPTVNFDYTCGGEDSASFSIVHVIKEGILGDSRRQNDTVTFEQKFYNYYAYDDGTAEAGYGLTPANSTLAYKFTLNHPDTLRAVKMFFNQTYDNATLQYFYLTLWNDDAGYPKDIIYQHAGYKPVFTDSLNKYHTYYINDTTIILGGTFYVGWQQMTDDNLNLGFDKNTDVQDKIFYNTGSGWANTMYHGALMIRPVLGKVIQGIAAVNEFTAEENQLMIYPNPTNGNEIHIQLPSGMKEQESSCTISIYDMFGRLVCAVPYAEQFQLPEFSGGIYILGVTSPESKNSCYTRISVVK
jgi:hypothetical protein